MIDTKRRTLLKGSLAAGSLGVAVGSGLLTPAALAAWNETAFGAKDLEAALAAVTGGAAAETSEQVQLKVPDIAENGAVVPVTVETDLADVTAIAIFAAANAAPLIASFDFGPTAVPFVSTRIKMAETAQVVAVIKAGGKFYKNAREVKVTAGGCGG